MTAIFFASVLIIGLVAGIITGLVLGEHIDTAASTHDLDRPEGTIIKNGHIQ